MTETPEWPDEIWMLEREEYDQGVVAAILSEFGAGDRLSHRYVDADIHESADKYWRQRVEALEAENKRLREALSEIAGQRHQMEVRDIAYHDWEGGFQDAVERARAALAEQEADPSQ